MPHPRAVQWATGRIDDRGQRSEPSGCGLSGLHLRDRGILRLSARTSMIDDELPGDGFRELRSMIELDPSASAALRAFAGRVHGIDEHDSAIGASALCTTVSTMAAGPAFERTRLRPHSARQRTGASGVFEAKRLMLPNLRSSLPMVRFSSMKLALLQKFCVKARYRGSAYWYAYINCLDRYR